MIKLQTALTNTPSPSFPTGKYQSKISFGEGESDEVKELKEKIKEMKKSRDTFAEFSENENMPAFARKLGSIAKVIFIGVVSALTMKVGMETTYKLAKEQVVDTQMAQKYKNQIIDFMKPMYEGTKKFLNKAKIKIGEGVDYVKNSSFAKKAKENKAVIFVSDKYNKFKKLKYVDLALTKISEAYTASKKFIVGKYTKFVDDVKTEGFRKAVINMFSVGAGVTGAVEAKEAVEEQ